MGNLGEMSREMAMLEVLDERVRREETLERLRAPADMGEWLQELMGKWPYELVRRNLELVGLEDSARMGQALGVLGDLAEKAQESGLREMADRVFHGTEGILGDLAQMEKMGRKLSRPYEEWILANVSATDTWARRAFRIGVQTLAMFS